MNTTLHADNFHITHITEDKFTGMSRYGRNRKTFDIAVIHFPYNINILCEFTKTGTQDDGNLRTECIKIKLLLYAIIAF